MIKMLSEIFFPDFSRMHKLQVYVQLVHIWMLGSYADSGYQCRGRVTK